MMENECNSGCVKSYQNHKTLSVMEKHAELTDDQFEEQFFNGSLDPAVFSHEAHLRLAWIHINKYGVDKAIENISAQLQRYVESLGVKDKYNATVTIAAIRAVYHFMLKSNTKHFDQFIAKNQRLKLNFKELLGYHYTTDIFTLERARNEYVEPELLPFD